MAKSSPTTKAAPKKPVKTATYSPVVIPDDASGLQELFESNIRCLYWVENHLVKALPKMVAAAGSAQLQQAFEEHLAITKTHVARLERVFALLGKPVQSKKSDALEGLAMDGEHVIEETDTGSAARDTGLVMSGQLVENYEITAYSGVLKLAGQLGYTEIATVLQETLAEEQTAADILAGLSEEA